MPMLWRQSGLEWSKAVLGLRWRKCGTPRPRRTGMTANDPHRCRCAVRGEECGPLRPIQRKRDRAKPDPTFVRQLPIGDGDSPPPVHLERKRTVI